MNKHQESRRRKKINAIWSIITGLKKHKECDDKEQIRSSVIKKFTETLDATLKSMKHGEERAEKEYISGNTTLN